MVEGLMSERHDNFDRGERNRRAMLGDEWVDRSLGGANAFNADLQDYITRNIWGDIWSRPGLDFNTRRLLVLAMTMAQARWEEFELHCRAALRGGVPLAQVKEVLLQGAAYLGAPAANTAFKITGEICKAEGIALQAAQLSAAARVRRHDTFSAPSLHVALQGTGPGVPIVMSHALGMDLGMWDALAAALAPEHSVLRYDHRGQGRSAVPTGPYTIEQLVDDAARLIREGGQGPVVFIGLSMGGMVAQGLAIAHPQLVRGLVLANTASQYPQAAQSVWTDRIAAVQAGGMAAMADMGVERFLTAATRASRPALAAAVKQTLLRADAAGYIASCEAIRRVNWAADLGRIACPTAVIAGSDDLGTTPAMNKAIAQAVPGASYTELPGVAHLSSAEAPEALEALVRGLLARVA
jgi:3-oxoadipate enol-lactonase